MPFFFVYKNTFGKILESTCRKPIVEGSRSDIFWRAIRSKNDPQVLIGVNALGRLLMELRESYLEKRFNYEMFVINPPDISDFKILGNYILTVDERKRIN